MAVQNYTTTSSLASRIQRYNGLQRSPISHITYQPQTTDETYEKIEITTTQNIFSFLQQSFFQPTISRQNGSQKCSLSYPSKLLIQNYV